MSGSIGAVQGCVPGPCEPGRQLEFDSSADTAPYHWPHVSTLELGALPTAVPCARLHARNILLEWNFPYSLVEDAEVLVSELMTNALQATQLLEETEPIGIRLLAYHERVVIEVWDSSPNDPVQRLESEDSEGGRGLTVIGAISNRCGFRRVSYRVKVVWCGLVVSR